MYLLVFLIDSDDFGPFNAFEFTLLDNVDAIPVDPYSVNVVGRWILFCAGHCIHANDIGQLVATVGVVNPNRVVVVDDLAGMTQSDDSNSEVTISNPLGWTVPDITRVAYFINTNVIVGHGFLKGFATHFSELDCGGQGALNELYNIGSTTTDCYDSVSARFVVVLLLVSSCYIYSI